jgi:hypothetical protein
VCLEKLCDLLLPGLGVRATFALGCTVTTTTTTYTIHLSSPEAYL